MSAIIHRWGQVVAFFVLFALLSLIGLGLYSNYYKFESADSITSPLPKTGPPAVEIISGAPERLVIEGLGIDLPVKRGMYDTTSRTWTLDDSSVFINTLTNDAGIITNGEVPATPLIYGHNYGKILGKTRDITAGDTLTLYTNNGYIFSYVYASTEVVRPEEASILSKTTQKEIMIMTCSGVWDERRSVLHFTLTDVSKAQI